MKKPPVAGLASLGLPLTERSRNLVRFCRHLPEETMDTSFAGDFGFRDAGSRFAILKSVKTAPGPDECFGLWARDDRTVFRKLLGMTVDYDGLDPQQQAQMTTYNTMNYYRSHVVEHFCHNGLTPMPPTEGECTFWFAATDVLCIRYRLVNKSAVEVPVRLGWFAEGEPGEGFSAVATATGFRFDNRQTVISHPYTSRAELLAEDDDVAFAAAGPTLRSPPVARTIPAHGTLECRFACRFWFNDEPPPEWPAERWSDRSLEQAMAETEEVYAGLPALPPTFARHFDLTLKAVGTLRSLRYRDYDGDRQRRLTMHVGKSGTAATWFWDTGVSLPGLALMREREASAGAVRILLAGIKPDGTPPVTYEHQQYLYSYQIPLLTWGLGHYLALCPDPELLADAYEPLGRYVRHWLDRYTAAHGLVAYPPGGTSLDDALRWHTGSPLTPRPEQPWQRQEWGRTRPDLFASPDINAFLYLELRTLAEMATALGQADQARDWHARADGLATAINDWLVEPTTQTYQDRHLETGTFTGLVNMASFIPIYAGIAPAAVAAAGCRNYLLSPEHFLTAMPFPVIDRAHPTFRSGGFLHAPPEYPGALVQQSYWRGRTWIHGDAWLLGALWQGGCQTAADALADRILEAAGKSEGICECYDSLSGYGNGHPEFLWSSAAMLMLAHRFYALPPVATLAPGPAPAPALAPAPAPALGFGSGGSPCRRPRPSAAPRQPSPRTGATFAFLLAAGIMAGLHGSARAQALPAPPRPVVQAGFNADGLASLQVNGGERLANGRPAVQRVVATDRVRDRHAESQEGAMYAADEREFSDLEIGEPQRRFDAKTRTLELTHAWGTVAIRYAPAADRLDITVDIANRSDRFLELVDLALLELTLGPEVKTDMPRTTAGWAASDCNLGGPDLARARLAGGQVLWLSLQPARPLRQRLTVLPDGKVRASVVAGDARGGTEVYDGQWDTRTLPPDGKDRYELSLRFGPADESPFVLAEDLLQAFGKAVPATLDWPDRRPIAAVHVADGRSSERNPRGWVHGLPLPADWDVNAPDRQAPFRAAALRGAENIVQVARRLGVQGVIVWQIEGMEWKDSAYYGNPQILPHVAPEMDAVADDFFAVMRKAGLRVGITIRPVIHFPGDADQSIWSTEVVPWEKMTLLLPRGGGYQVPENCLHLYAPEAAWCMLTRLDEKIAYAKKRWGATLFYIDTNNIWRPRDPKAENGGWSAKMLTAELFRQLAERHPDVLLIPEHEHLEYYAHTAPHSQPPGWGSPTGPDVRAAYPESFCTLVTTDESHLITHLDRYVEAMASGDLYLPHGWFGGSWDTLVAMYQPAAALAPFQLQVHAEGLILNDQAIESVEALGGHLAERLAGRPPLKQRRVFVLIGETVPPERLAHVLDAVAQAGGIVAWSQPLQVDWPAYWRENHPLRPLTPNTRAILLPGQGEARIVIVNASPEQREVAVAMASAGLGLGVKSRGDLVVEPLPGLSAPPPEPPPAVAEIKPGVDLEVKNDAWLGGMLQGIEADVAENEYDPDTVTLDLKNHRQRGDTVEVLASPFGIRVLRVRPRWPEGRP